MDVELDVKRTFIVDGKEYASPDEMPDNICQGYEKAMARSSGAQDPETRIDSTTEIVFNGVEYKSVDSMRGAKSWENRSKDSFMCAGGTWTSTHT